MAGGREVRRWRLVRARPDAQDPSVRRWYSRLGAPLRRRSGIGYSDRAARRSWWMLAGVAVALAGVLSWLVLATPLLGVREVRVTGTRTIPAQAVVMAAAIEPGTPLARVDTAGVAGRVRELRAVASVDVYRSWPSTVVIAVTERTAAAVVARDGQYLVLDPTGVVFDERAARPAGLLLLRLADPGPQDPATAAALQVVAALTPALRRAARELVVHSPASMELDLTDGRVVFWGDASASLRKAQVATALLSRASTRIDVSSPDVVAVS